MKITENKKMKISVCALAFGFFAAAASTPLYAVDPLRPQEIIVVDEGDSREITDAEKQTLLGEPLQKPSKNTYVFVKDGLGTLTVTGFAAAYEDMIQTPFEVREGTLALTNSTLNITSYPFGITVSGNQANLVLDNSKLDHKRNDGLIAYQVSATVGGMDGDGSVTLKNNSTWSVQRSLYVGACTITWQGAPTALNPGSYKSTDTSSTEFYRPDIPANKDSVGKIEVLSGSSLEFDHDLYLYGKGSSLTVSGEGSTVSATRYYPIPDYGGSIFVGYHSLSEEGQTTLNVLDGGKVSAEEVVSLGVFAGDYGVANISGAGSSLETSLLFVGCEGTGEMTISDGGKVRAFTEVYLGIYESSNGTLSVSGAGSSLETQSLCVGSSGTGEMTISDGGTATARSVYVNSASSLAIMGGTLVVYGNDTPPSPDEMSLGLSVLRNEGTISIDASAGKIQLTGDSATISNTGKFVISAGTMDAGTTATVVTDKSGDAVVLTGTVNAFGGTYENGVFTAGAKETVDGPISSDKTVAAGCRIEVTHSESTVVLSTTTKAITVSEAKNISESISVGSAGTVVLSAWAFSVAKDADTEVMVTLDVGENVSLDMIRIHHKADGSEDWDDVTGTDQIANVTLSKGKLSFTTKKFSSYAATTIPEPSQFGLLAGLAALALAGTRRRRRK